MGVVEVPLVVIGKDFVGLFRGLEADLGFFALVLSDLVGVVRQCGLRDFSVYICERWH
jgi:hypothetical protein